jgi:hypothetical protein
MFRKFVDRAEELNSLEKEYTNGGFSFTVIYGRRRIGKTELITHYIRDKPHIYFLADHRGTSTNVERFRKRAADFFDDFEPRVEGFDDVFEYIAKKWDREEKLVVAIDEFSYLVQQDGSIPSVFQLITDEILRERPVHLILCGSSISMMEKSTLAHSSPLYGRRTSQIQTKPIPFRHIQQFFPDISLEECMQIYGVTGGIPYYLLFFDPEKEFAANLENNVFATDAVLYEEGDFLLREELREPATFMNILYAIATGASRPAEIATRAYLQPKDISYYLKILMKLGFVSRQHPIADKPATKKTIYRLEDNFLRFWFRFVLPHKDELEPGNVVPVLEDIKKNYDRFLGMTFEDVGKETLIHLNSAGKLPFTFRKIGRQWGKIAAAARGKNDYEIDLVALNAESRDILFCECKWQKQKVGPDVYYSLKEKGGFVDWHSEGQKHFALISRAGFTPRMREIAEEEKVILIGLADMIKG